ncbi:hypothetical protein KAU33_07270 [Candidatus Dependentiae bacterium]|nr:hypothetical protein [Candidatus Dependentiae bacterium]
MKKGCVWILSVILFLFVSSVFSDVKTPENLETLPHRNGYVYLGWSYSLLNNYARGDLDEH